MKLKLGDWVRVEMGDGLDVEGLNQFTVLHDVDVVWDGRRFLGCTLPDGSRASYTRRALLRRLRGVRNQGFTTDAHCMIEQLVAEGAF